MFAEAVDIRKYPSAVNYNPSNVITLGDMHGNTMKLIWCLIREGVIEVSENDFNAMWSAYDAIPTDRTAGVLNKFKELLNSVTVNSGFSVCLLGDLFSDRGNNDYFTLKVLEKLHQAGVKPEITYSNHDVWLLDSYNKLSSAQYFLPVSRWPSLIGLYDCVFAGIVEPAEVQLLVKNYILPHIKPIAYILSEDKKTIDLFMHAPNNFAAIKKFTEILGIADNYQPKDAVDLAKTLDEINVRLQKLCAAQDSEVIATASSGINANMAGMVLHNFIWNRMENTQGCIDFTTYPVFVSHVVHGHTEVKKQHDSRQINLDSTLGKVQWKNQGEYLVFLAENTLPANIKRADIINAYLDC